MARPLTVPAFAFLSSSVRSLIVLICLCGRSCAAVARAPVRFCNLILRLSSAMTPNSVLFDSDPCREIHPPPEAFDVREASSAQLGLVALGADGPHHARESARLLFDIFERVAVF